MPSCSKLFRASLSAASASRVRPAAARIRPRVSFVHARSQRHWRLSWIVSASRTAVSAAARSGAGLQSSSQPRTRSAIDSAHCSPAVRLRATARSARLNAASTVRSGAGEASCSAWASSASKAPWWNIVPMRSPMSRQDCRLSTAAAASPAIR